MIKAEDNNERSIILGKYYGTRILVKGTFTKIRRTSKDKKNNIEPNNDFTEAHNDKQIVNPIYFFNAMTLLTDVEIINTGEMLDHIWISENIQEQIPTVREGDVVEVSGVVRKYIKHNGTEEDYCINEYHVCRQ